ncbi:hypothetical protein Q5752_004474 [Cryptotrichosporon argae]
MSTSTASLVAKAKGRAKPPPLHVVDFAEPIVVDDDEDVDEDEDEFEEVAIPSGPTTSAPGTPLTRGTSTAGTPGAFTDDTGGTGLTDGLDTDGTDGIEEVDGVDDAGIDLGDLDEPSQSQKQGDEVIRLEIGGETDEQKARRIALAMRKKPMTAKDRALRLEVHKAHTIALLAHVRLRNRWCCNALLQARLLSLLPHPLQAAFTIPPRRFPDRAQRSRLFLEALQSLVTWYSQSFFDISDVTLGLQTRTWDDVQDILGRLPKLSRAEILGTGLFDVPSGAGEAESSKAKGKGKDRGKGTKGKTDAEAWLDALEAEIPSERLRSVNSLMKKALQQEGSRDVAAQLFVALARACGLGTRLVASLQPVPWRAEKGVVKKKVGAGRGGRTLASRQGVGDSDDDDDDDEFEEVEIPSPAGKAKEQKSNVRAAGPRRIADPADLYRLKKPKPPPQKLAAPPRKKRKEDLSEQPPVFWAEVFSRSDQRWIPVDPVKGIIRKKAHFEPSGDAGPVRMLYVVAYEEDGYARDVTLRYTKNFGAKTSKLRPPARKDEIDWWTETTRFFARPYRLNRDDLEDAELEMSQVSEGMPLHMNGFKDHPIYVLERHLKREEVLNTKREIGRFKGEPVYRRTHVVACKTAEGWMRLGRRVRAGQEPMKWVKQRAVTIQKRRAQELAHETGEEVLQGLYGQAQTEIYRPPPIKDGIIPQNSFGNIDLYAPTMLPEGAVHLPYKGIARVVKSLGVSYAEACTGFEFKKQRAIPVINGIVVAAEKEGAVMAAYWESTAAAQERERVRREERALKRWAKLVNGLRVRRRLRAEYGAGERLQDQNHNPLADPEKPEEDAPRNKAADIIASANLASRDAWADRMRSPTSDEVKPEPDAMPELEAEAAGVDALVQPALVSNGDGLASGSPDFKPVMLRIRATRGTGRKRTSTEVDNDDEDDDEPIEVPPPRARPARAKAAKAKASQVVKLEPAVPTRVLRSRAPRDAAAEQGKREKRARLGEVIGSDDD